MKMLKVMPSNEAAEMIIQKNESMKVESETVHISACCGRILAEDIFSPETVPSFDRSTVDGYAVKSADTFGSSESIPAILTLTGEVLMGEKAECEIKEGQCAKISTGGMLPEGADSVVMVENTDNSFGDGTVLVYSSVSPLQNVTKKGDDVKKDDRILKKGTLISSRHIGVLASLGIVNLTVFKKLKVGIISSGDEIVPIENSPSFGQVRDINSHILFSLMSEKGCECISYGILKDNLSAFELTLKKASAECDLVLISGGSSAGTRDMTAKALSNLGEVCFHGIAVKPGKPTIFGKIGDTSVFGLPGHPAAAYLVALRFVVPLINKLYCTQENTRKQKVLMKENVSSNHGREEILPVKICENFAEPILRKSGVISLLCQADGYIIIDRNKEGLKQSEEVEVILF